MTHAEKVLALLSDGQPHGHMELYRLGVMAHSRISDLRKRGHNIVCWRDGDNYLYQLIPAEICTSPPLGEPPAPGNSVVLDGSSNGTLSEPESRTSSSRLDEGTTPTASGSENAGRVREGEDATDGTSVDSASPLRPSLQPPYGEGPSPGDPQFARGLYEPAGPTLHVRSPDAPVSGQQLTVWSAAA